MSVTCGKGHKHNTVAEVRACYGQPAQHFKPDTPSKDTRSDEEFFFGFRGPSEKQLNFLVQLLTESGVEPDMAELKKLTGGKDGTASQEIDRLLDARKRKANAGGSAAPQREPYPDVPAGHYAVPSLTGNNDLDFFRVDRPTEGTWKGRTFVKRVIGGHPDTSVRGVTAVKALKAILAQGIDEARTDYGTHIGRCWKCNRHLTDETSRALGIGPDCRAGL